MFKFRDHFIHKKYEFLSFLYQKRLKTIKKKYLKISQKRNKKMSFMQLINDLSETYPKPLSFTSKTVSYGTAGFRMK